MKYIEITFTVVDTEAQQRREIRKIVDHALALSAIDPQLYIALELREMIEQLKTQYPSELSRG